MKREFPISMGSGLLSTWDHGDVRPVALGEIAPTRVYALSNFISTLVASRTVEQRRYVTFSRMRVTRPRVNSVILSSSFISTTRLTKLSKLSDVFGQLTIFALLKRVQRVTHPLVDVGRGELLP